MEVVLTDAPKEYDAAMFIEENQANTYLCTICQFICNDVVSVECGNGHIFCKQCMESYVKHSTQCPNCQKPIISIHDAKFINRLIQSLQVKCISICIMRSTSHSASSTGSTWTSQCQWTGSLHEARKHYQTQCEYTLMRCTKCGCDEILRKDCESHIREHCAYTLVECPNKEQGCKASMERRKVEEHVAKFCSLRSLHCPYTKYGCLFTQKKGKLGMKELQSHLTDSQYRILHLELQLHSLSKKMEEQQHSMAHPLMTSHHGNLNLHALNQSNCNLLFAYIGSDEGKYAAKNCILCIDIHKGVCDTLLDALSIALINHEHNSKHANLSHDHAHTHSVDVQPQSQSHDHHQRIERKRAYSDKSLFAKSSQTARGKEAALTATATATTTLQATSHQHRQWDIRNHGACVANHAFINEQACTVLFRVGGWNANDEQEVALPHVDGYVVEHNQWLHTLPGICSLFVVSLLVFDFVDGNIIPFRRQRHQLIDSRLNGLLCFVLGDTLHVTP